VKSYVSHSERTVGDVVGEEIWRSVAWLLLSLGGTVLATAVLGLVPYNENTVVTVPTVVTITLTLSLIVYRVLTGAEARFL